MTSAGVFCPQCQVYHPHEQAAAGIPGYCPSCGCSLPEPAAQDSDTERWFFARQGQPAGPYTLTELRLLAAVGDLNPTDLLWKADAGPNPSTQTARAVLAAHSPATATPSTAALARPAPPWAAESPLKHAKFLRFPTPSPAPVATLAAEPTHQPVRTSVAVLIVSTLVVGLIGLRYYVENSQGGPAPTGKKDEAAAAADPANKSVRKASKGDLGRTEKSTGSASSVPTDARGSTTRGGELPTSRPALKGILAGRRLPEAPGNLIFHNKPAPKLDTPGPGRTNVLAQIHCSTGWATFGQALPPGATREGLKLGDLATQTDVKTRWPDGTVRFAIVTARVTRAGTYPLTPGPLSNDTPTPAAMPLVWLAFATGPEGKQEYTVGPTEKGTGDVWLRGPLVYEERQLALLRDAKGTPHPFLRVVLDLRVYRDGQARADLTIENTLSVPQATAEAYTVWIGDSTGKILTTRTLDAHPYLTRWRHLIGLGLHTAQVRPDLEPVYQARALPRYLPLVAAQVNSASGANFEPLQTGDLAPDMTTPEPRPEVAPYPDWTARYLVHRDPRQLPCVLAHGDLAGSWPIHVRKADGSWPRVDDSPRLSLASEAPPAARPAGNLQGRGYLVPDVAHQPSLAYVPYLLTGDRYYADEMAFWANHVLLATAPAEARESNPGLLASYPVPGIAWGLRDLADVAAYLPDSHPLKKYFGQQVEHQLRWLDRLAEEQTSPLGTLWHDKRAENRTQPSRVWIAPAEQNYLAWAIDHAHKQGFAGGLKHRDRIGRFQLSLFASGPQFRREFGAPDLLAIGARDAAGKPALYATVGELFRRNFGDSADAGVQFAGYHGPSARLMLLLGIEQGWPGAKEAHTFLWPKIALETHTDNLSDLALRAGWAIASEPSSVTTGRR